MAEPTKEELMARVSALEKQLVGKENGKLEFKVLALRNRVGYFRVRRDPGTIAKGEMRCSRQLSESMLL